MAKKGSTLLADATPRSDQPSPPAASTAKPAAAPTVAPPASWVGSPISSFIGSFLGLGGLFVIENGLRTVRALPDPMLAVGSFAAVATLLYAAPNAPLGAPKNLFYGHFLSICAAIVSYQAGVLFDWHPDLVVALAPSLAIAVMVQQKSIHPPGGACAFIFASQARAHAQPLAGTVYLLVPGLLGCAYMLAVQRGVHAVVEMLQRAASRSTVKVADSAADPEAGK